MASFDYHLNPLYPIKECSSCGALYTMDYCCSEESLMEKIICDLNQTPELFQRPSHNYPKCGNPVDGQYCQGCALLRKKFKEDLFTYCIENEILQDSSEPSNDNTNVVNVLQEPFVVKRDPGKNSSQRPPQINHHCCYWCGYPLEDIFCHQCTCELCGKGPFNNQTIDELPQTLLSFDPTCYSEDGSSFTYDSKSNLVDDSPNVFDPPSQPPLYSCEFYENNARYGYYCTPQEEEKQLEEEQAAKARYWKIPVCYDDDDDEDYTIAITHKEPDNSLNIGDEHLDTILATKSDEFIKSSVENLVPNPSESEGEHECDVPACEVFTTFYNILFDADYDFSSSDDQSFFDEDILKEIYSNPLFDEAIISMMIDPHNFNAESDLIESLLITILQLFLLLRRLILFLMSSPVNPLFSNQSRRELIKLIVILRKKLILSRDCYDSMPPGIKEDDYDSERDILILEELISNDSLSLHENESFHFDIPSYSRPPTKPPDGNT
nr:hypothetical protein [Tanacetum cinerariifolium]